MVAWSRGSQEVGVRIGTVSDKASDEARHFLGGSTGEPIDPIGLLFELLVEGEVNVSDPRFASIPKLASAEDRRIRRLVRDLSALRTAITQDRLDLVERTLEARLKERQSMADQRAAIRQRLDIDLRSISVGRAGRTAR